MAGYSAVKPVKPNLRVNIWRLLKSEPSIEKLIENKSDLSKLSTLSETSIVKFIENQSEHLTKLTLYHLQKRATKQSRRAREPSRIPLAFLRDLDEKNSMLKNFVFKKISKIEIPKFWQNFIMHDINVITNAIQR